MLVNFLNIFEDRVSGIFGAARAPFSFKKLAKQAAREMEDQTLVVNGVNTAPALYTILIANDDDPLMAPYYPQLSREVADLVKAQAQKKHYAFAGEPLVRFMIDPSLRSGKFSVFAENVDAPTLGRLYEEERAYQSGLAANPPAPQPASAEPAPSPAATPQAAAEPIASGLDANEANDPFAPSDELVGGPIPVPKTLTREQIAGMGGAAATGGAISGAAALANGGGEHRRAAQPARPLAQLVDVVTGDVYEVKEARCVVGRERTGADIVLRDPNVSRRHAELMFTGSDWSIEDLNSTNGTLVNNRRVTRCPLRNGDLLTFGLSTFEFRG